MDIGEEEISMSRGFAKQEEALGYCNAAMLNLDKQGYTVDSISVSKHYNNDHYVGSISARKEATIVEPASSLVETPPAA